MKRYLFLITLLMTQTINAQPKDGEIFEDWITRCVQSDDAQQCYIEQNIVAGKETKHRFLTVQIGYYSQRAIANFIPPLGVLLQQGIKIDIDGFKFSNPVPYTMCNTVGCSASLELDQKMIGLLKKGNRLTATIYNPNGKEMAIGVSLKGFTPAFNSLSSD